jgi:CBS domain-containing protein
MLRRKIGCLPVVKGERLVGLVTESDLLRAAFLRDEDEDVVVVGSGSEAGSGASGSWRDRFEHEMEELRRLRDELRVRIHLGKADARDAWDRLEQRFGELEGQAKRAAQRTGGPLHELGDAARHLLEELRAGYRELRGRF